MFFEIGKPLRLSDLGVTAPQLGDLKHKIDIAVIDDEPFIRLGALRNHGFRLVELGGDTKTVEQVAAYPIVICDIKGVGRSFESKYEGAHVIAEIRKAFPDKYLIAFTGMTFDASYNEKLAAADKSVTKDDSVDLWIQLLETALANVGDPRERWLRFRANLLKKGVELHKVFLLEQAFIKTILRRDSGIFENKVVTMKWSPETTELLLKFAKIAVGQIVSALATAHG